MTDPTKQIEQQWVERAREGDHQAFNQLVRTYQGPLIRFLRMKCQHPQLAEDLFQETFINAFRYLASYRDEYAFSTWLFNIAVNLLKKHHRIHYQNNAHTELLAELDEEHSAIHLQIEKQNIWQKAQQLLTPEQVELLWFTYVHGYTGQQVSEILDRSVAWIKINLIRSKNQLKEAFPELAEFSSDGYHSSPVHFKSTNIAPDSSG